MTAAVFVDAVKAAAGAWDSWMWLPVFPLMVWLGGKVEGGQK